VCVEDARQHDVHEEALRSALFFGKPFVLQIAAACDSPDGQHDALAAADEMPRQRASDVSTPMIAVVMN
jgi:hypothetical protein